VAGRALATRPALAAGRRLHPSRRAPERVQCRLTLARATVERFLERAHRLYEQERGKPEGFPQLGAYVRRWARWTTAGLRADIADSRFRLLVAQ
jgi:hypothetical protein